MSVCLHASASHPCPALASTLAPWPGLLWMDVPMRHRHFWYLQRQQEAGSITGSITEVRTKIMCHVVTLYYSE